MGKPPKEKPPENSENTGKELRRRCSWFMELLVKLAGIGAMPRHPKMPRRR